MRAKCLPWSVPPRFAALNIVGAMAVLLSAGCGSAPSDPRFAENMGEACLTLDGCQAFLEAKRVSYAECEVGRRPTNCDEREVQVEVARRQVARVRKHRQQEAEAAAVKSSGADRSAEEKALALEHQRLMLDQAEQERQAKQAEREAYAAAWGAVDAKACAVRGDESACYDLVKFLANHPVGEHEAEAREALAAGQKLIGERAGKPPAKGSVAAP